MPCMLGGSPRSPDKQKSMSKFGILAEENFHHKYRGTMTKGRKGGKREEEEAEVVKEAGKNRAQKRGREITVTDPKNDSEMTISSPCSRC